MAALSRAVITDEAASSASFVQDSDLNADEKTKRTLMVSKVK